MTQAIETTNSYALGHSSEEQRRLDRQGAVLRPFTTQVLTDAGIGPGMRVLDVGCGTGDVTLLAAELVGSGGSVVGVDRVSEALATAAGRTAAGAWNHVTFLEADLDTLGFDAPFDAVIGRLVLMYQADPVVTLRHLASLVRPGGSLAFLEIVLVAGRPAPDRPLFARTFQLVAEAFAATGAHIDMGLRLEGAFRDAGLPNPAVQFHPVTVSGPDLTWFGMLAGISQSLLSAIEQFGLASATDVVVDTLFDRLLAEAAAAGNSIAGPLYVGASARRPVAGE